MPALMDCSRDLTTLEGVKAVVSSSYTPLGLVTTLSGGYVNSTYRAALASSDPTPSTIIIKHAAPHVKGNHALKYDPIRCVKSTLSYYRHSIDNGNSISNTFSYLIPRPL